MGKKLPKAIHDGEIKIGDKAIPCAVLEDGTRILASAGFLKALDRPWRGKYRRTQMPNFLAANNLKSFIDDELYDVLAPVDYIATSGVEKSGYKAELLPKVCVTYLRARDAGVITKDQENVVIASDLVLRALAQVGVIALVDEATGYQDFRTKQALQKILERFIAKELQPWVKTFQDDYYKQIFRLNGWPFKPDSVKRPQVIGKWTNDLIYDRLAPGIKEELHRLAERDEKGRPKHRLFQRLTEGDGHPKLREHLSGVTALMRAAPDWRNFKRLLNRAYPKLGDQLPLDLFDQNDDD